MKGFVDAEVTFKMTFGDDDSQTILHGFIPCVKGAKIVLEYRKDCKTKKDMFFKYDSARLSPCLGVTLPRFPPDGFP